jgi:hypothetical protein
MPSSTVSTAVGVEVMAGRNALSERNARTVGALTARAYLNQMRW